MGLLDFKKPSEWSLGKWIGIIAILILLIGPALPYKVNEAKMGDEVVDKEEISGYNFDYDVNNLDIYGGFWIFIPILTVIVVGMLLFLNFNIFLERGNEYMKINNFIIMAWGFIFFLCYLSDAILIVESWEAFGASLSIYAGIGLWLIVLGFLLVMLAGFFEWRYPSMKTPGVPKVSLPLRKKEKPSVEVTSEPTTEVVAQPEPQEGVSVSTVKEEPEGVTVKTEPAATASPSVTDKVDMLTREPTSEEEKNLLRWARHINEDGQTFEQCMKCNNYVFITAKDTGPSIVFECPDCGEKFELKK